MPVSVSAADGRRLADQVVAFDHAELIGASLRLEPDSTRASAGRHARAARSPVALAWDRYAMHTAASRGASRLPGANVSRRATARRVDERRAVARSISHGSAHRIHVGRAIKWQADVCRWAVTPSAGCEVDEPQAIAATVASRSRALTGRSSMTCWLPFAPCKAHALRPPIVLRRRSRRGIVRPA